MNTPSTTSPPHRPLILIVEDNYDNINLIEEMLERYNFDYNALADSTRILEALDHSTPDLILLDLYMPQQNGLETLTIIKTHERHESIPVLMLTAETDKEMLSRCLAAGAMDYLNKPVDEVELQARIRSALRLTSLNRALAERNAELDQKNKEMQKMIGTVVHDLKNPLTVITASIDFVRSALLQAGQDQAVDFSEMIRDVAFSMRDSINDMLNVSRIQQGALQLNLITDSPYACIHRCVQRLRQLAAKKSIGIVHDSADLPAVRFDEKGLYSVIMNLVDNAIKYSSPNSQVRVSYEVDDQRVKVLVTDRGQGLSKEDVSLAFKEFQTLSSKPTHGESSTGLGLAIVKSTAEAMGSTVGVESEGKDKGATFWVALPRVEAILTR